LILHTIVFILSYNCIVREGEGGRRVKGDWKSGGGELVQQRKWFQEIAISRGMDADLPAKENGIITIFLSYSQIFSLHLSDPIYLVKIQLAQNEKK